MTAGRDMPFLRWCLRHPRLARLLGRFAPGLCAKLAWHLDIKHQPAEFLSDLARGRREQDR